MDKADLEKPDQLQAPHSDPKLILSVFVALLGIHTLCLGQQLGYTDDALPILRHTEIVVRHHSFTAPISPEGSTGDTRYGNTP